MQILNGTRKIIQYDTIDHVLDSANGAHDERVYVSVFLQHLCFTDVDGPDNNDSVVNSSAQCILHHEHDNVENLQIVEEVDSPLNAGLDFILLFDISYVCKTNPYDVPACQNYYREKQQSHSTSRKEVRVT